ncbi:GNAT family N-acetyltransferase [Desulfuribacillus stibiiarsenatis]|uniref:GNAT family N-acetyltransferase n=1 Tax=Desulfuribacillus stibiiarsenatis TaxID=1390249 RepID=A0A1E5L5R6_9FIRM|nr:GNAT family protein [Desulfuribacillus stibiiarsenatis]OEH85487.1 GNAT family N-acetyltransferase [Desulfuribacillus stibiiarsenatis]
MLKGESINLQAIEREDLKLLMLWRNLPNFRKHFREYREINMAMQENWFTTKVLNDPNTLMFSIRRNSDSELLGCCGLCYINWINRHADLSLYIGWEETYIDEVGYAEESCNLLFNYAFNELNLNKIWTEIYEFDTKKIDLYQKLGFQLDGKLRQNYYYNGQWWDSLLFSVLKKDWASEK